MTIFHHINLYLEELMLELCFMKAVLLFIALLLVTSPKFILVPFLWFYLIGTVLSPRDPMHFEHDLC